jgi:hypothetical protein
MALIDGLQARSREPAHNQPRKQQRLEPPARGRRHWIRSEPIQDDRCQHEAEYGNSELDQENESNLRVYVMVENFHGKSSPGRSAEKANNTALLLMFL